MQATEPIIATAMEATPEGLVLTVGKRKVRIAWEKCSDRLASATDQQRMNAELSSGGYGIHWPSLDEDLSVHGLVRDLA